MTACDDCLRRTDLIAALAGHIDIEWREKRGRPRALALPDETLLHWAGRPDLAARHEAFDPEAARERIVAAGLRAVCRCDPAYPTPLREIVDPPAVLHVLGEGRGLGADDAVAVVGARRASSYGLEVGRALGRGLGAAGLTVVSGMALGIDSAAHAGALEGGGVTVAVLAGGAERPYPPSKRGLHAAIAARGCVVSEMPPGFTAFRWCFPARNRIIAGLAQATVVVEGGERSGSLITADLATDEGRLVAAVPGQVTSRLAGGTNSLLKQGAELVRDAQDVLDLMFGPGAREAAPSGAVEPPEPELRRLLRDVEAGRATIAALARPGREPAALLRALSELERRGLVRREFGGRYFRAAG